MTAVGNVQLTATSDVTHASGTITSNTGGVQLNAGGSVATTGITGSANTVNGNTDAIKIDAVDGSVFTGGVELPLGHRGTGGTQEVTAIYFFKLPDLASGADVAPARAGPGAMGTAAAEEPSEAPLRTSAVSASLALR